MLEIYTPEAWFAFLGHSPKLVIDDDGKIYTKEDFDRVLRNEGPIGKIDYDTGLIYGKDFRSALSTPIGKYAKEKYHECIYGPNYSDLFATPIYYLKDGAVYTPEEYNREFFRGEATAFIKDISKNEKSEPVQRQESVPWQDRQADDEKKFSWFTIAGVGLVRLFVVAFYIGIMGDLASGDSEAIATVLISLASCILISLFIHRWPYIAFGGAVLSAVIYQLIGDAVSSGLISDLLLGCLLTLPLGSIIWLIRKAVDKYSTKSNNFPASIPYLIGGAAAIVGLAVAVVFVLNSSKSVSPMINDDPIILNEPSYTNNQANTESPSATDNQKIVLKEPGIGSSTADYDSGFIEERLRSAGKLYSGLILWQEDNTMLDKTDWLGEPNTYESLCRVRVADNYDELVDYFHKYYTAEATEKILRGKEWKEENGKLYVEISFGLGGQTPDYEDVVVTKDSDTQYTVQLIQHYDDFPGSPDTRTLHLVYENNEWVWDDYLDDYYGIYLDHEDITIREFR